MTKYPENFTGEFKITPALLPDMQKFLLKFSQSRRVARKANELPERESKIHTQKQLEELEVDGEFFVDEDNEFDNWDGPSDSSIINYNIPPKTQPGLWCQWIPNEDGTAIVWDGGEKFYKYTQWIVYIIKNFLEPFGYSITGEVKWVGKDPRKTGTIKVVENSVLNYG